MEGELNKMKKTVKELNYIIGKSNVRAVGVVEAMERKAERELQTNIPDEHRFKNAQQNTSQQSIRTIINPEQVGFTTGMQGWLNKSINMIHCIKKRKN